MGGNKISAPGVSLKWVKAEDVERKTKKTPENPFFVVKKFKSRSKAISGERRKKREKKSENKSLKWSVHIRLNQKSI